MGKKKKKQQQIANVQNDGMDVEYSAELADANDIEANERGAAADRRAKKKKKK
ncbi:YfhD family protein [Alkalihalobacterium alkalinitrilicum]|uniref:YfhD family protein n=1 Tax=Alkalihalobacterium alkalinitrilicum TaxID=427920 RepID=UPI000994AA00|nr:YfhD family protein [Alkalihalobacterium alkalinitrilicum]